MSELVALLSLSSWCLVMVVLLFLAVPRVCLRFVIVVFTDNTHLLFWYEHDECVCTVNNYIITCNKLFLKRSSNAKQI